jgi:hypothetical protein
MMRLVMAGRESGFVSTAAVYTALQEMGTKKGFGGEREKPRNGWSLGLFRVKPMKSLPTGAIGGSPRRT